MTETPEHKGVPAAPAEYRPLTTTEQERALRITRPLTANDAELALENRAGEIVAHYLRQHPVPARAVILRLANMLDPNFAGDEWLLTFKHRRRGNSKSPLSAELNQVGLGIEASDLYAEFLRKGTEKRGLKKRVVSIVAERRSVSERLVYLGMKLVRANRAK